MDEIITEGLLEEGTSNIVGFITLITLILLERLYQYLKVKPDTKKEIKSNELLLNQLFDTQLHNSKKISKIEKFTAITANKYTTTLPENMMEHIIKIVFSNSRCKINATIFEWIRDDNLSNPRVLKTRNNQIIDMINNVYDNDIEFFDHFHIGSYMEKEWSEKVIKTCLQFIKAHSQTGNHFKELQRNLKNDFTKIENEFIKKMKE